jgi:SAM-dependent methyltransferase
MGKGAPLRWIENYYLRHYLRGDGIEIGGLWRKFKVPARARVWYLDRLSVEELARQYTELGSGVVAPDLIADAEELPIANSSLDFIIASHVLEHLRFPLLALKSWYDALNSGGILILKVPDKRYTFDCARQRTPLQHLIQESENPGQFDIEAHYADWVEHISHRRPGEPEFRRQLDHLLSMKYSIHYHVWIDSDVADLVQYTREVYRLAWRLILYWGAHFYRKECVLVLRKDQASSESESPDRRE